MSSSEDEDENMMAKNHLKLLLREIERWTKKALSAQSPNDPRVEAAIESGTTAKKAVKEAIKMTVDFEAGVIKYENLEDVLQDFLFSIQVFLHSESKFKEEKDDGFTKIPVQLR